RTVRPAWHGRVSTDPGACLCHPRGLKLIRPSRLKPPLQVFRITPHADPPDSTRQTVSARAAALLLLLSATMARHRAAGVFAAPVPACLAPRPHTRSLHRQPVPPGPARR